MRHQGTTLSVNVRLNHVTSNVDGYYTNLVIEDLASGLQLIEVKLSPEQVYEILANRGSGSEGAPARIPVARGLEWLGQRHWGFDRTLGHGYQEDDLHVHAWAARVRDDLALHTYSVTRHNYGVRVTWAVYSNSITDASAAQYRDTINAVTLPPKAAE